MIRAMKYRFLSPGTRKVSGAALIALMLIAFPIMDTFSQDVHFSQFYASPLLLNPANTGMTGENIRFANSYRNQWAQLGVPFQTLCTSLDRKLVIAGQTFGVGGTLLYDQSSSFLLSANQFMLSFSYSRIINNQEFTVGFQPGIVFKSFNQKGITFYSQFDPSSQLFNSTLPNLETGMNDHLKYFDLNMGIAWRTLISTIRPAAGISVSHLNMPVERFESSSAGRRLPMKLTFNSEVEVPLNSRADITPSLLYSFTPGAYELVVGSLGNYMVRLAGVPIRSVYAITMFRLNPPRDIDAVILGGGAKFLNFDMGLTYDFNISPLRKVASFNGAFEISLIYTGRKHSERISNEPCHILN
jgi:type IX secretion system PorP/SprF family membrane protein